MEQTPLLKEKITETLRENILQMRSDSLVRIAPERALAESLGVSRVSLRAAIKSLTQEGLLVQIQGKGTYITPGIKLDSLHIAISPDIKSNDPFYNKFLVEITNLAAKHSINLAMVNPNQLKALADPSPLIVVGLLDDAIIHRLKEVYSSILAIQDYPITENIPQVCFDDYKIGCKAAKTLMEYNHQRILLLAGPERYPSAAKRKEGFLEVLKKYGIGASVITESMNWTGGSKAGEYIANHLTPQTRPTAVFAANDWMAAGLIQKLREYGLQVPQDISVIGCDNIPLASEFFPGITTFNLDMKHLVEELFSVLNKGATPHNLSGNKTLIPAKLIHRGSLVKI